MWCIAIATQLAIQDAPNDATCFELLRDKTLRFFSHPTTSKVFFGFAVLVSLAVVAMGLIMCWAMLGLFFEIPNGWDETMDVCLNATGWNQTDMGQMSVPLDEDGEYASSFCNLNQWWFNTCMKVFVVLFSYVNFLPIPWRLSILHHVYCSHRPSEAGVDFYGRPSDALWFNIPKDRRRRIAVGLNMAWIAHFVCLATHMLYSEYIEGQTFPGILFHNLPFVLSITFQVMAAVSQSKAENVLIAEQPERFPQKAFHIAKHGYRKWRKGLSKGSLIQVIRAEFKLASIYAPKNAQTASGLTGCPGSYAVRPLSPKLKSFKQPSNYDASCAADVSFKADISCTADPNSVCPPSRPQQQRRSTPRHATISAPLRACHRPATALPPPCHLLATSRRYPHGGGLPCPAVLVSLRACPAAIPHALQPHHMPCSHTTSPAVTPHPLQPYHMPCSHSTCPAATPHALQPSHLAEGASCSAGDTDTLAPTRVIAWDTSASDPAGDCAPIVLQAAEEPSPDSPATTQGRPIQSQPTASGAHQAPHSRGHVQSWEL